METVRVEVTPTISNLPQRLGFTSTVLIDVHEVIEELIEDESGLTTLVRSYMNPTSLSSRILLKPRNFTPRHLSRLLCYELNRELPFCQYLAEIIASFQFSLANNNLDHQRPFLMSVNVAVIKELRFILQPVVYVSMIGASRDVFQRLLEEQKVESFDLDETCSICIEKLSEEIHGNNIIQMPNCLHLFHQDCIFEWLSRHNLCPLCRRVTYEEDQDQDSG